MCRSNCVLDTGPPSSVFQRLTAIEYSARHTHSTHPKTPMQANLTPSGQAAHLRSTRTSYSFAQGGSRSNRGWPGQRHPKTATQQTVPGDTKAQTAPQIA